MQCKLYTGIAAVLCFCVAYELILAHNGSYVLHTIRARRRLHITLVQPREEGGFPMRKLHCGGRGA